MAAFAWVFDPEHLHWIFEDLCAVSLLRVAAVCCRLAAGARPRLRVVVVMGGDAGARALSVARASRRRLGPPAHHAKRLTSLLVHLPDFRCAVDLRCTGEVTERLFQPALPKQLVALVIKLL